MTNKNLILFGYSGHAMVVEESAKRSGLTVSGYFDKEAKDTDLSYMGNETDSDLSELKSDYSVFASIGSNEIRASLFRLFEENSLQIATIIDPSAIISDGTPIGTGTLIAPGAIINPGSSIGKGCIINSGAIVEHECIVGDFSHIAPGAILCGNIRIGNNTFVGAGSVVKEGLSIGNNVVIGAGSVVLHNIPDNETWVGNPSKKIKDNV